MNLSSKADGVWFVPFKPAKKLLGGSLAVKNGLPAFSKPAAAPENSLFQDNGRHLPKAACERAAAYYTRIRRLEL